MSRAVAAPEAVPTAQSEWLESLSVRVGRLEQRLDNLASGLAALKSEVATLVGAIGDIKKANRRPATAPLPRASQASSRRPRAASAIVVVGGLALGIWGWTLSSRDSITATGSSPAAVQQPIAPEDRSPPLITTASTTARRRPARDPGAAPTRIDPVGTLSIDSVPGGEVFINRKAAGRTPLRVQNLKAGSHLVWIERDGYLRWTREVQVPADRVTRLSADLEPIAAQ